MTCRAALVVGACLLATGVAAPSAGAAGAATPAGLGRLVDRALASGRAPGERASVLVRDLGTGEALVGRDIGRPLIPASNEKLVTAAAAVAELGAQYRFRTELLSGDPLEADGVVRGALYVRGSGDPTLSTPAFAVRFWRGRAARLTGLIAAARQEGLRRATGGVVADASAFDQRSWVATWKSSYLWVESPPISALPIDRGSGQPHGEAPPLHTAAVTRRFLGQAGVPAGAPAMGRTPPDAVQLAVVASPPLETLLAHMLTWSDNWVAEQLLKAVGHASAGTGTTATGAAAARRMLTSAGARTDGVFVADGSGLSRANRLTTTAIVDLLSALYVSDGGQAVIRGLPIAARTGTLHTRMYGTAAAGRVRAKTGTLNGVSALSGVVTCNSGRVLAFSILMNGPASATRKRAAQDRIAAAVAAYEG
jgi:D-alanyl-D-alanine carboxypeptidase/D-alanyl-D-alanine-endopeptidase (penicillin-binding protein 4)